MAAHSRTIAWKISWTAEPGRLQSMGSQRVRHDWATSLSTSLWGFYKGCSGSGLSTCFSRSSWKYVQNISPPWPCLRPLSPPRDLLIPSESGMNSLPSVTCWSYLTQRWKEGILMSHLCKNMCVAAYAAPGWPWWSPEKLRRKTNNLLHLPRHGSR